MAEIDTEQLDAAPKENPKYAFRRRLAAAAVVAAAGFMFAGPVLNSINAITGTGAAPTTDGVTAAGFDTLAQDDQILAATQATLINAAVDAQNHWLANGNLATWAPPTGIGVARSERSVIVAAVVEDGRCAFVGLIGGYMNELTFDDTGVACQPDTLAAATEGLVANDTPAPANTNQVTAAARRLVEASTFNVVDGAPSFAGMATAPGSDVTVTVAPDGQTAQVTVTSGGCATALVTAGDLNQAFTPNPC